MKIVIGADKSGFYLKEAIKAYLESSRLEFVDLGTLSLEEGKPYYQVAKSVAPLIQNKTYDKAILICGTGMGMSIVSNKYQGVYAAACESLYAVKMARAINNANILCLGGWIVGEVMGVEFVKTFLETEFLEDLEPWRQEFLNKALKEVKLIEDEIYDK
ncbi:MAG: RpiB/LacA/LacB family sugar-phosphate isomerase [Bacilli bacterium]|nr:RpiB/LacA/LacB family sugar-phosphate isomerase [Bacilli bacterium]